jgi:hypothetical protein
MGLFALAPGAPARAEAVSCQDVLAQLQTEFQRGASPDALRATAQRHPECAVQIRAAAEQARANAKAPGEDAKGFLGPIGWLWNNVYYKVYQGNLVMMLTFGWGLLLAPIIVVVCAVAVLRGAKGAFRQPTAVPPTALSTRD